MAFILKGLHENDEGHLFSIDLPFFEGSSQSKSLGDDIYLIPKGMQLGWMVPEYLRNRWELVRGDCRDLLIPLLDRLGSVNLFLQDDLHSYRHMLHEFLMVWPKKAKTDCC
jgi:hypothetical protein